MFLGIAAVIAVVAVIVLSQSGSGDSEQAASTPTPTSTPTSEPQEASPGEETPTPTATPRPRGGRDPITLRAGSEREIEAEEGETVRFRVVSSGPEEIHVHGYDITEEVGPGNPARFSFKADITGIFEIEFHGSGEVIGSLKVEP